MLPHRWDISPREAVALQRELAVQVKIEPLQSPVRTVAGADCAFVGKGRILAVAVLCDARTMKVIDHAVADLPLTFPYVPGLLSVREAPAILSAVQKLPRRGGADPGGRRHRQDLQR